MYICIIKNSVRPEGIEEYKAVSSQFAHDMKNVPGCIDAYVIQDQNDSTLIANVEVWENREAKEQDTGTVFQKYKPLLKKYFVSNQIECYSTIE
ncbi:MAG: antibiotic biosynthesis monooxygenase family protein [Allobaculum sp.]